MNEYRILLHNFATPTETGNVIEPFPFSASN